MSGIWWVRLAAAFVALMLSRGQSRFFDCNKMPMLSVLSGTVTLLLVYAMGEALYRTARSDYGGQIGNAVKVLVGGGALVGAAGWFTLLTHICP